LAAGLSRRFGAADKLLADLGGRPVVRWAAEAMAAAPAEPRLVIAGANAPTLRALLADLPVEVLENLAPERGQASSIAMAATGCAGSDGLFIALGDMPFVQTATYAALAAALAGAPAAAFAAPTFQGRRGHPVLFSRRAAPALTALSGDVGARAVLERHADTGLTVSVDDEGVTIDVDTETALARARRRIEP